MKLRGTAIVTGASSGIGMALAERAARAGWNVFAVGRRTERLDELKAKVAKASGSIATLALDVRAPQAAKKIVRGALEAFGGIDVLVNNAGGVAVGPIAEQTDGAVTARVHPTMVPQASPLARVDGVFNAVVAEGDFAGRVTLEGRGAGAGPTASAVVSDITSPRAPAAARRSPPPRAVPSTGSWTGGTRGWSACSSCS